MATRRCALDAEEAQLLAQAIRGEIWRHLGKASLHEYLEDVLGYSPRQATERIRVATALEDLPAVAEALASDGPDAAADPALIATPLRFDVRPATRALLRQAQRVLEAERGHRLDDDELIAALCGAARSARARGAAPDHVSRLPSGADPIDVAARPPWSRRPR